MLWNQCRSDRLHRGADHNRLSIADSGFRTPCAVGYPNQITIRQANPILDLSAGQTRISKGIPHFHAFDRLNTHDGHCEPSFETFVPLRKASQANRYIQSNDLKDPTQSILSMYCLFDFISHFDSGRHYRAPYIRLFRLDKSFFVWHVAKISLYCTNG